MRCRRLVQTSIVGGLCLLFIAANDVVGDDPPESATSRFLGAETERAGASFVLQQASPLFGGREYYVSGDGQIAIVDIRRQAQGEIVERRFEIKDANVHTDKLFALIRQVDLLGIPLEQVNKPGPTCTTSPLFIIRNGAGEVRALPLIKGAPTKDYEKVCLAVAALMKLTRGKETVYEGAYEKTYIPKGFEWAKPILDPGKTTRWAPHATPAEIEEAEQAYRKKVELQVKLLEKNRAKAAESRKAPTAKPDAQKETPNDKPETDKGQ